MYLALKWLIALGLVLWASLCFLDSQIKLKKYQHEILKGLDQSLINKGSQFVKKINYPLPRHVLLTLATISTFCLVAIIRAYFSSDSVSAEKPSGFFTAVYDFFYSVWEVLKIRNWIVNVKYYALKMLQYSSKPVKMVDGYCNTPFFVPKNGELAMKLLEKNKENEMLKNLIDSTIDEKKKIYQIYKDECVEKDKLSEHLAFLQLQMKEKMALFQSSNNKLKDENRNLREEVRRLIFTMNETEMRLRRLMREVFKSNSIQLKMFCERMMLNKDFIRQRRRSEREFRLKEPIAVASVPSMEVEYRTEITKKLYNNDGNLTGVFKSQQISDNVNGSITSVSKLIHINPNKSSSVASEELTATIFKRTSERKLVTGSEAFQQFLNFGLRSTRPCAR